MANKADRSDVKEVDQRIDDRGAVRRPGAPMSEDFPMVWWWKKRLPERKGQRCRVLARGALNSIEVEFEDGYRVITSRYAVRRVVPAPAGGGA